MYIYISEENSKPTNNRLGGPQVFLPSALPAHQWPSLPHLVLPVHECFQWEHERRCAAPKESGGAAGIQNCVHARARASTCTGPDEFSLFYQLREAGGGQRRRKN
ncbi:Hypothetical predicted protein [Podarcis lilfordi]|uniref:Uncharacterized protein n=1 Tax=Podarcis lilfordi TaxID=74358 RepID=A0AA35NY69_9SAUR|nr:Hypothetical predicted protein [Podarcis lilfordi]